MSSTALLTPSVLTSAWPRRVLSEDESASGISNPNTHSGPSALAARALGPECVFGLLMPEADSSSDSTRLGQALVNTLGVKSAVEDIRGILQAAGCYRRRDEAIRSAIPE